MAYGVKSHKFLCCLPVRLGVFVLSFCQFVFSGALAGLFYYLLIQKKMNLEKVPKIVVIVLAAIWTIISIVSVLGFIGSIFRRYKLVRLFSSTLNWLLGINVVLGVAAIIFMFIRSKSTLIEECINGSTDQDVINACSHINTYRFVSIGGIVISWIIQLYECIIVARYVIQLQEEREEKWRRSSAKTYTQVAGRDSLEALHYPVVSYPYADKERSHDV